MREHNLEWSVGAAIHMERTGRAIGVQCHVQETQMSSVVENWQTA